MGFTYAQFQLKTGGTGSTIGSPIKLGFADDEAFDLCVARWEIKLEGPLIKAIVDTFYFGAEAQVSSESGALAIMKSLKLYADSIATSCQYRPYTVKELSRGKAVIPHVHEGWGDLQLVHDSDPTYTILANCTLESAELIEDSDLIGAAIRFTFTTIRSTVVP